MFSCFYKKIAAKATESEASEKDKNGWNLKVLKLSNCGIKTSSADYLIACNNIWFGW